MFAKINICYPSLFLSIYIYQYFAVGAGTRTSACKIVLWSCGSSTSLKLLKRTPTLKAAFAASLPEDTSQQTTKEQTSKKPNRGKTCSGHFGCNNIAVFREDSGTLLCRDHKPKSVPTKPIVDDKQTAKSGKRK